MKKAIDCIRNLKNGEKIVIRNPHSVRPYQYVLDVLFAYLLIVKEQYNDINKADNYNIGPSDVSVIETEDLVNMFCKEWGENASYLIQSDNGPYESNYLILNSNKIKEKLNWKSKCEIKETLQKIVEFEKYDQKNLEKCMEKQGRRAD